MWCLVLMTIMMYPIFLISLAFFLREGEGTTGTTYLGTFLTETE